MYLARFSYDIAPANRERALKSMRQELDAPRKKGLDARILIPLTRAHGGPALRLETGCTDTAKSFSHPRPWRSSGRKSPILRNARGHFRLAADPFQFRDTH